jgi:hypothetical protein
MFNLPWRLTAREMTSRIAPTRQRAFTSLLEKRNWHAVLGYVNLESRPRLSIGDCAPGAI